MFIKTHITYSIYRKFRKFHVISENILNEGVYSVTVDIFLPPALPDSSFQVRKHNAIFFEIIDNLEEKGARGSYPGDWQAGKGQSYLIRPITKFETKQLSN